MTYSLLNTDDKCTPLPKVRIRSEGAECVNLPSTSGNQSDFNTPCTSSKYSPTQSSSPTPPWTVFPSSQPGTSYYDEIYQPEISSPGHIEDLLAMFPLVSPDGVKFLFKISNHNAIAVTNCLIDLNIEGVLDLIRPAIVNDSPKKIRLDEEDWESDDNLTESLIAFYKDFKFNTHAAIRVCIPNQPVIDTGGARRQLFSRVLATMAKSDKFNLFEGPHDRLRPTFKQSSVSSGMLHILGRMIGHSIVMDGQGFPFLSPPCYYYMCGYHDRALSLLQQEDVGELTNRVIQQVSKN